jgi:release factor glutamine methyltransferase
VELGPQRGEAERSRTSWTVLELLRWTTGHFAALGIETPRLDAECLLAHALGVDRLRLYLGFEAPVSEAERGVFRELVHRRGRERVPVAQLVGRKEFWSLRLRVTRDVLVPRPETETLVAAALELLPPGPRPVAVLDVGTGSGAVALAIARERPAARITATDVSSAALEIARLNADELGMAERIRLVRGAGYTPVAGERFDLVVSNPPYVAESQRGTLPPELAHEPPEALFAGPDGLGFLRELVSGAGGVLAPGGGLALEHAPDQASRVAAWCREAGLLDVRTLRDLAGRPRVVAARSPAGSSAAAGGGLGSSCGQGG